jgi:DeoR family fructose operon transcriptional repressor
MGTDKELRIRHILRSVDGRGYVSVRDLRRTLGVSGMTIRRDLEFLEDSGYLIRKHGGAVRSEATNNLFTFDSRVKENQALKEEVCLLASRFIRDSETIFIDCGTTVFRLCRHIVGRRNLRVVTNSLPVVAELMNHPNIKVSLVGGDVDAQRRAAYGSIAEQAVSRYRADKAFLGAGGISAQRGLSSFDQKEGDITVAFARNARSVFLLCDSTKLERDTFCLFAPLSIVQTIITNPGITPTVKRRYAAMGINVVVK